MSEVLVGHFNVDTSASCVFTIPETWRFVAQSNRMVYLRPDKDEQCIRLIPGEVLDAELKKLGELALFDIQAAQALKVIGDNTHQCEVDKDGNIEIPECLRSRIKCSGCIELIGDGRTIKMVCA